MYSVHVLFLGFGIRTCSAAAFSQFLTVLAVADSRTLQEQRIIQVRCAFAFAWGWWCRIRCRNWWWWRWIVSSTTSSTVITSNAPASSWLMTNSTNATLVTEPFCKRKHWVVADILKRAQIYVPPSPVAPTKTNNPEEVAAPSQISVWLLRKHPSLLVSRKSVKSLLIQIALRANFIELAWEECSTSNLIMRALSLISAKNVMKCTPFVGFHYK